MMKKADARKYVETMVAQSCRRRAQNLKLSELRKDMPTATESDLRKVKAALVDAAVKVQKRRRNGTESG